MKTILIVEDNAELAWFLGEFFRQNTSYHTLWSNDGLTALKTMEYIKPDLLLLDYRLPGMNGLELYNQLGTHEELATIPAILMTANMARLQLEGGRRAMVVLEKPFDLDTLREVIDKLLA